MKKESSSAATTSVSPRLALLVSVWFALIAAAGELAQLGYRKFVLQRELFLGPHILWMTPAAYVLLFLLVALLLIVVSSVAHKLRSLRVLTGIFAFLTVIAWLLLYDRLQGGAALLLSAGIAVNAALLAERRAPRFLFWLRRSTPVLAALAVTALLGVGATRYIRERTAIAKQPAAEEAAPNIVLIIWDTVRALSLSAAGYGRATTPNLAALTARGVYFDAAMSTSPWTLPSHASMFTGRYPHELSADFTTPLDDAHATVAEVLAKHGYLTAGFIGNTFYCGFEYGLDRGFIHYEDFGVNAAELLLSSSLGRTLSASHRLRNALDRYDVVGRKNARQISNSFLQWLPSAGDRPFFAFLNYYDAHEPYLPPAPFRDKFGSQSGRRLTGLDYSQLRHATRWGKRRMNPTQRQLELDAYEGAIAYLDAELQRLIDELARRGVLENTVIIVTSDHGEHLGERGMWGHGNSLYSHETHVPLLIIAPHSPAGIRVREPVSLRDMAATVLQLAGVSQNDIPGSSLARFWDAAASAAITESTTVLSQFWDKTHSMKSVVVDGYHYIQAGDREEAYNLERDPGETDELIGRSAISPNTLRRLRTAAAPWPRSNHERPARR